MNRRGFLRAGAAAAAGGWTGTVWGCGAGGRAELARAAGALPPLGSVGLQMSTIREPRTRDPRGTLAEVARAGYRMVETSGDLYAKMPAAELRAALDEAGLRAATGMYPYVAIRDETDRVIAAARTLGQEYVCIPALPEELRPDREAYRTLMVEFNELGGRLRDAGLVLAYHNHAGEFETLGGDAPILDLMLEETDPDRVAFELDLYWIDKAGYSPLDYIQRYPGRFPLYHLKDSTGGAEKDFAPVGAGVLDFAAILSAANAAGYRYGFVEHDRPAQPLESMRTSYANLSRLLPSG